MAEFQANEFTTTLVSSISSGDVTLTLASTVGTGINGAPSAPFRVRIEDEIILVGTRVGTLCSVLSRGEEATTAAFHAGGTEVRQVLTVAGLTDAIVSYAAPLTATFVTSTDQTSTLTNSRQILAGTNITLDTSIAGDLTINASGGSATTPGGSDTMVQFNDSNLFGGDAGFLYNKTTDHVAIGPSAALGVGSTLAIREDFAPAAGAAVGKALISVLTEINPSGNQTSGGQIIGSSNSVTVSGSKNIYRVAASANFIDGAPSAGTINRLWGNETAVSYGGAGTVTQMYGLESALSNYDVGTVATALGVAVTIGNSHASGTITSATGFDAFVRSTTNAMTFAAGFASDNFGTRATDAYHFYGSAMTSGTITDAYGLYLGEINTATRNHYLWLNADGVFAIDDVGSQAKASLYNPGITKYTSGSANYERSILQWNSNVLEMGTQAGGTGTLRHTRFLGDAFEMGTASGSNIYQLKVQKSFTASSDGDQTFGVDSTITLSPPADQANTYGYGVGAFCTKISNFDNGGLVGIYAGAEIASGSGDVTHVRGLTTDLFHSGSGIITNLSGVFVNALTAGYVGAGPVTNAYGIFVDDVTIGGTLNYAIYTNAGTVRFGDDIVMASGQAFGPTTTTAETALLRAYDVDGTAYKTFATLTNGNTPDFTIGPPSGGTVTVQASTFKSSDGSTGATGTATAANTLTIKNGLVTNIA